MEDDKARSQHAEPFVPMRVRVASGLLLLILVTGAVGIGVLLRHILTSPHESAGHRADDLVVLVERTLQWTAAGVAFLAVRKRRAMGRWLTAALAFYIAIKIMVGFRGALQVILGQPDTVSTIPFTTPTEGVAGVLLAGAAAFVLLAIAFSMAFNVQVRTYFASE